MVILEQPYVSGLFLNYLQAERIPVLQNPFSLALPQRLRLIDDEAMRRLYWQGQRLYTSSENALAWVQRHLPDSELAGAVNIMKDKAAMRRRLRSMYPGYFFREIAAEELAACDISHMPVPFVLKPSVGFFSLGVYIIHSQRDWLHALREIELHRAESPFPLSVVNQARFILEEYIRGDEFAVDMYYDQQGEPVILNIMQHRFASDSDVRDRLYITSQEVLDSCLSKFYDFFVQINRFLNIKNFPAHVELRVREGMILPIEFNPLRFAGLCTTDLAYYAYGLNTVDCYLKDIRPDLNKMARPDKIYSMIIADKPAPGLPSARFDYPRLRRALGGILELRPLDIPDLSAFAIVFNATGRDNQQELENILHADFRDYLLPDTSAGV